MKKTILLFMISGLLARADAQTGSVGIGTTSPHSSAALDVQSSTKGLLVPSMAAAQRAAIANPAKGLIIFQTAQEVEEAARKLGITFSGVDIPKNQNDFYGLRYAEFVVPLTKAVQEQQQMIIELKKKLR